MIKWFLVIQVAATWPAAPPQLQFLGPMDEQAMCEAAAGKLEKEAKGTRSFCLGLPSGPSAPPAPPKQ